MKLVRRTCSPSLPNEQRFCATDCKSVVHSRSCRPSRDRRLSANHDYRTLSMTLTERTSSRMRTGIRARPLCLRALNQSSRHSSAMLLTSRRRSCLLELRVLWSAVIYHRFPIRRSRLCLCFSSPLTQRLQRRLDRENKEWLRRKPKAAMNRRTPLRTAQHQNSRLTQRRKPRLDCGSEQASARLRFRRDDSA